MHTKTNQYIHLLIKNILVHARTYWYKPVRSDFKIISKKCIHGLKPVIFCILFACLTTALQAHSKRNVDMNHLEKNVTIQNKTCFQLNYLALDDGSTAPVPLRRRLRP